MAKILNQVRDKAMALWEREGVLGRSIDVTARTLSTEEAIGNPEGDDFPLQQGRERLMEAVFSDNGQAHRGQAFTDLYGDFSATLGEIAAMPLTNNFRRAVFVAALNASMRALGRAKGTVHCRDTAPNECAGLLAEHILERFGEHFGRVRVAQVGFQPAMVQALGGRMELRVLDLDEDNIGQVKRGCLVEGPEALEDVLDWADVLNVTGTTLANDTIDMFLVDKPVIFYGTTIAGAAALMGWDRFCAWSS